MILHLEAMFRYTYIYIANRLKCVSYWNYLISIDVTAAGPKIDQVRYTNKTVQTPWAVAHPLQTTRLRSARHVAAPSADPSAEELRQGIRPASPGSPSDRPTTSCRSAPEPCNICVNEL